MFLPYGVNKHGELIYIDQLPRGRTSLRCPYCGMGLIARKGQKIAPHFAHDGITCREVKRAQSAIALPMYDSFNLSLSGREWKMLQEWHDDYFRDSSRLEELGLVKQIITYYGNRRWELTHKGKIPFGELSLDLFNRYQETAINERYDDLLYQASRLGGSALIDLQMYRAQLRRILSVSLYFLEVRWDGATLHKIGVTARPMEERMSEIRRDLMPHCGEVELIRLGEWPHRGNVELYFKYRYRARNVRFGSLTEYFDFDGMRKKVLLDLRRMKPKELTELEREILNGR